MRGGYKHSRDLSYRSVGCVTVGRVSVGRVTTVLMISLTATTRNISTEMLWI